MQYLYHMNVKYSVQGYQILSVLKKASAFARLIIHRFTGEEYTACPRKKSTQIKILKKIINFLKLCVRTIN